MGYTVQQVSDALKLMLAVARTCQQAGIIDSLKVYAMVQDKMDLGAFYILLSNLEDAKLITFDDETQVVTWVGPKA